MISSVPNGRWIGKLDRFRQMANVPMAQNNTNPEPIVTLPTVNNRIEHRPSSSPKQARQQSKMKRQGRGSLATSSESSVTTISRHGSASNGSNGSGAASKGSSTSSILIDAAHRAKRSRFGTPFPIGAIQSASSSESDATDSDNDNDKDERARRRDSIVDFDAPSSSPPSSPLQSSLPIVFEPIVVDEDEDTMEIPETVPMPVYAMQRTNAPAMVLTSTAHMRLQLSAQRVVADATVAVPNNACSCSSASSNQIMEVLETLNRQLAAANAKTARVNAMVEDAVKHLFILREEQVANEAECAQLRAAITIMHKQFNVM